MWAGDVSILGWPDAGVSSLLADGHFIKLPNDEGGGRRGSFLTLVLLIGSVGVRALDVKNRRVKAIDLIATASILIFLFINAGANQRKDQK